MCLLYLGIDIGGSSTKTGIFKSSGECLARTRLKTPPGRDGIRLLSKTLADWVLSTGLGTLTAAAAGCPGPLDSNTGVLHRALNLPGWENIPVASVLEDAVGIPVFLENDANLAALGEWWATFPNPLPSLACLTLGTGVGGGIVLEGKIFKGSGGRGGEFGHITVQPDGNVCGCGSRGCLETFAGGVFLSKRAEESAIANPRSLLAERLKEKGRLEPEDITIACENGDEAAIKLYEETGKYLGIAIGSIINIFAPEEVVISGGVSRAGGYIMDPLLRSVEERTFPEFLSETTIRPGKLLEHAGVSGAAKLAMDNS